jgi:branched-chain amino acid transport system permease protein
VNRRALLNWGFGLLVLAGIAAYPFIQSGYAVRLMTIVFFYAALAQSWNLLGGFAGYLFLGTSGFIGVGAYTVGIIMVRVGWSFWPALLVAGLVCALLAVLVGIPILRLRTGYFAVGTLGLSFILRELANNLTSLTGGGMGLSMPILNLGIDGLNRYFYFVMVGLAGLGTLLSLLVSRSRLGYGLRAIKEDEEAAGSLGIHTTLYKVIAFTLGSMLAGLAGGAYGFWLTFLEPGSMFDSFITINVIAMVLLGGGGTVFGPVIGAVAVTFLSEMVWNRFLNFHQGVLGILLITVVILVPRGFVDAVTEDGRPLAPRALWNKLRYNVVRFRV